jgi:hypothetical protein
VLYNQKPKAAGKAAGDAMKCLILLFNRLLKISFLLIRVAFSLTIGSDYQDDQQRVSMNY